MYTRNSPHEHSHRSNADHIAGRNGISQNAPVQGKFKYDDSEEEPSIDHIIKFNPGLFEQNYGLIQVLMRDPKIYPLTKGAEKEAIEHYITEFKSKEDGGLPKIIHFIWIGASMPEKGKTNVLAWKKRNPTAQIWLWSDSRWHDRTNHIQNGFGSMSGWAAERGITIKDISADSGVFTEHYKKEAGYTKRAETDPNDTWTNFGTASDLARYSILSKYGGIYSDSDLGFRENAGQSESSGGSAQAEQQPDIFEEAKRKIYKTGMLTHNRSEPKKAANDLIASLPGAENISLISANAEKKLNELYADGERLKEYPSIEGRLHSPRALETMMSTGPEEMRAVLRTNSKIRGIPGNVSPENRKYFSGAAENKISADDLSIKVPSLAVGDFEGSDMSWLQ
jgi:hypothetical protein